MTPGPTRKAWTRRQYALYWLFVISVCAATIVLSLAAETGDRLLAAAVVGLALVVFIVVFVVWVFRLLRNP